MPSKRRERQARLDNLTRTRVRAARGEGPPPESEPFEVVQLLDGSLVPRYFGATFEDRERGYLVELSVEMDGRDPTCVALSVEHLDGSPLWHEHLRGLPLRAWLTRVTKNMAFVPAKPGSPVWTPAAAVGAAGKVREALPRRRVRITDATLREVAEVYRANIETGAPTAAVAARFHRSHSTAGKWVGKARARGFLGPTRERVAGEQKKSKKKGRR